MHEGIHHFLHNHSHVHIHTPKKLYIRVKTILWDKFLNFFELVCLPWFFFFMERDKKLHWSIEFTHKTLMSSDWREILKHLGYRESAMVESGEGLCPGDCTDLQREMPWDSPQGNWRGHCSRSSCRLDSARSTFFVRSYTRWREGSICLQKHIVLDLRWLVSPETQVPGKITKQTLFLSPFY